jgi:hypothetical protein
MNSLEKRPKRKIMDKRFGTWVVRSMYRVGSLMVRIRWAGHVARMG